MSTHKRRSKRSAPRTSWDPLAKWYDGWVGKEGSKFHRRLAVPAVMELLDLKAGERVLDVGAGQGVLAPHVTQAGAEYFGIDVSRALLKLAKQKHGRLGKFILGDGTKLSQNKNLNQGEFDALIFLFSIQDMDPLQGALESASWALAPGGRMVILLTHPCFRVPRQSGWGWDSARKLQYRRIDRYMTPLPVPLKAYPGRQKGVTISFHRPLQDYINGLCQCGLYIDAMREIPTFQEPSPGPRAGAIQRSNQEIPLFLGLRARKL